VFRSAGAIATARNARGTVVPPKTVPPKRTAAVLVALSALAALAALAPLAPAEAAAADARIVGHWYGEGWQPYLHQNAQWLDDYRADGTFTMTVRLSDDCKTRVTLTSAGTWTYAADTLAMVTTELDGDAVAPFPHTYRMNTLTPVALSFVSNETATAYHIRRVTPDFKLPSCLTS
jgi:hypothetical protein